jgi:hypothetical protein
VGNTAIVAVDETATIPVEWCATLGVPMGLPTLTVRKFSRTRSPNKHSCRRRNIFRASLMRQKPYYGVPSFRLATYVSEATGHPVPNHFMRLPNPPSTPRTFRVASPQITAIDGAISVRRSQIWRHIVIDWIAQHDRLFAERTGRPEFANQEHVSKNPAGLIPTGACAARSKDGKT